MRNVKSSFPVCKLWNLKLVAPTAVNVVHSNL
jgi:hypothetical protein